MPAFASGVGNQSRYGASSSVQYTPVGASTMMGNSNASSSSSPRVGGVGIKKDEWPSTLKEYVERVFGKCKNDQERRSVELYLKNVRALSKRISDWMIRKIRSVLTLILRSRKGHTFSSNLIVFIFSLTISYSIPITFSQYLENIESHFRGLTKES